MSTKTAALKTLRTSKHGRVKQRLVLAAVYAAAGAVLGIPACIAALGAWIAEWKWPEWFCDALERWADRHGVRL